MGDDTGRLHHPHQQRCAIYEDIGANCEFPWSDIVVTPSVTPAGDECVSQVAPQILAQLTYLMTTPAWRRGDRNLVRAGNGNYWSLPGDGTIRAYEVWLIGGSGGPTWQCPAA
ncbi:MAG TPA: hypothetical protein PLB21_08850 [Actinomycetota bacterium]|nr:hypothetical protein [Actinomycetota bacterium]